MTETEFETRDAARGQEIEGNKNDIATQTSRIDAVGDPNRVLVMTANNYVTALTAQFASPRPLVFVIGADVSGQFTHPSTGRTESFEYDFGDVLWVPPMTVSPKDLFNIHTGGGEDAAARARLTAIEADDWVVSRRIADQSIETNDIRWGSLIGRHFRTRANGGGIGGGLLVDNALEAVTSRTTSLRRG